MAALITVQTNYLPSDIVFCSQIQVRTGVPTIANFPISVQTSSLSNTVLEAKLNHLLSLPSEAPPMEGEEFLDWLNNS